MPHHWKQEQGNQIFRFQSQEEISVMSAVISFGRKEGNKFREVQLFPLWEREEKRQQSIWQKEEKPIAVGEILYWEYVKAIIEEMEQEFDCLPDLPVAA